MGVKRTNTERLACDELTKIRERVEKATEGPWEVDERQSHNNVRLRGRRNSRRNFYTNADHDGFLDADFIAHAREDVPRLLAEVERLNKLVEYYAYDASSDGDYGHRAREYINGGDSE